MNELVLRETTGFSTPDLRCTAPASASRTADLEGAPPEIEMTIVTSRDGFEALEAEWNALHREAGRTAHVFLTFNWCWHWCRHYLGDDRRGPQLAIVTGRIGGRLAMVMPLVAQRSAGLTELTWLGAPVSQYGDVLAADEAAGVPTLLKAWQFAVEKTGADVANLRRVRADAVAAPLLAHLGAKVTAVEEAPYLDLSDDRSFAGWEERRQPKARKNRRRQARRLADTGPTEFIAASASTEAGAMARHAVRLKRETLSDKGAISLALSDDRFEAFFAEAAEGLGRPAGVTVLALTCDETPAALMILLETETTAFLHVAVFEPRFEKCGAGALLLEHAIERSILSGRRQLDLLPPRHQYKLDFGDGVGDVSDFAMALSTKGWLYTQGYLSLRRRLKAVLEGLPKPVRQAVARVAARA